jgi:monofunctional biosynthetic peptidoglycan transglycosylase
MASSSRGRGLFGTILRLAVIFVLCLMVVLASLCLYDRFEPPISTLMMARWVRGAPIERSYVPLDDISPTLVASVVMSEDARFCRHDGVDWGALREVIDQEEEGERARGASTIPMQTVKNLFLWPSRSVVRKGLEIPMALILDALWPKRRILEAYLNIAEWGDGIFGAEAAAQHYFHRRAAALDPREAALLATALPNPFLRDPARPSRGHRLLAGRDAAKARNAGPWLDCLQ